MTLSEPTLRHERGPVMFIADLHLDRHHPGVERFRALCAGRARAAAALYVLGDLFDAWIGDDDPEPVHAAVIEALAGLTAAGVPAYFMAGNRDFLIGEDFLRRTGLTALSDPTVVDLFDRRTLLCHGDTLCTDDVDYQRFRAQVRGAEWQREFLAKPLDERRRIADGLRGGSRDAMADKASAIMDVNTEAVTAALREHGADWLIHGHTHRPARHEHAIGDAIAERYVLSDWDREPSILVADRKGIRFEPVPD